MKTKKVKFKIEFNGDGVSIWYDERWILDASTFLESGTIDIDLSKFNKVTKKGNMELTLKKNLLKKIGD